MMSSLDSKTAVVTGVTSGIGYATARELVRAGANVIGIARNAQKLMLLSEELGARFQSVNADLALTTDRERACAELRESDRTIDIFVSNAAECAYESPLTISPRDISRLFEVNLMASIEFCQAVVPRMKAGGHIVQLSSVTARHIPNAKFAPYAATKVAIEHFVEALRLELHPRGIHVSLIVPGLVDTPIYDKVRGFEKTLAKIKEQVPNWLSPDDVAQAILWTLSRPKNVVISELTILPGGQTR